MSLNKVSFEVQFGIMAACVPTLPPGYKWLRKRMKSRLSSSTTHLPLAAEPGFRPSEPAKAHHADRDISNALRSTAESARAFPNRIQRTIHVDVERNAGEASVDQESKPGLGIDLGPRFESLRSLWATILNAGRRPGGTGSFSQVKT